MPKPGRGEWSSGLPKQARRLVWLMTVDSAASAAVDVYS